MLKPCRNKTSKKGVKFLLGKYLEENLQAAAGCFFSRAQLEQSQLRSVRRSCLFTILLQAHGIKFFMCVSEFANMDSKYCSIHQ